MASPVPVKSQPLHNFKLPELKWTKDEKSSAHHRRRYMKSPSTKPIPSSLSPHCPSPPQDSVLASPPLHPSPAPVCSDKSSPIRGESSSFKPSAIHGESSSSKPSVIRGELSSSKPSPIGGESSSSKHSVVHGESSSCRPSVILEKWVIDGDSVKRRDPESEVVLERSKGAPLIEYRRNHSKLPAAVRLRIGGFNPSINSERGVTEKCEKKSKESSEADVDGIQSSSKKILIKFPCKNKKAEEPNQQVEPPYKKNNADTNKKEEVFSKKIKKEEENRKEEPCCEKNKQEKTNRKEEHHSKEKNRKEESPCKEMKEEENEKEETPIKKNNKEAASRKEEPFCKKNKQNANRGENPHCKKIKQEGGNQKEEPRCEKNNEEETNRKEGPSSKKNKQESENRKEKSPCKEKKKEAANGKESGAKTVCNDGDDGTSDIVQEEGKISRSNNSTFDDETKIWNLRPRKPFRKNEDGGAVKNNGSEMIKYQSPMRNGKNKLVENEGNGSSGGGGGDKKEKKGLTINVALTKREIEEDIFALTGLKPSRRPKKRPKNIQKQIDAVSPGVWLVSITPSSYKVSIKDL